MDEQVIRKIQREGAEALLDAGVSVPLAAWRIPFRRLPFRLRLTMRRPTLAGQIAIARTYLSMDTTAEELESMTTEEQLRFMVRHGRKISRIIALAAFRLPLFGRLAARLMTPVIHHCMGYGYQLAAVATFVRLMGTAPFMSIIRSAEMTNPMKLRLSRGRKGS